MAANDAALGLLGAQQRSQVLGCILTTFIVEGQRDSWTEFARSVAEGTAQSFECILTDVTGLQRSIVFHGVPLVDHPDGVPSLILGARDASAQRRLEAALHESEASREKLAAERSQSQMNDVSGSLQELEARLQKSEAERIRLERALPQLPQLEQLLKQGRTHMQALRVKLEQTSKERDQLAARVSEREAAPEHLRNDQAQLQSSLESRQRELEEVRAQLQKLNAERDQVGARLAARETDYSRVQTEHAQLQAGQALLHAERDELRAERDGLRAQREQLYAERDELRHSMADRGREHDIVKGNLEAAKAEKEELVRRLAEHIGEHERSLMERDDRQQRASAQHQQALDALRVELDGVRVEADLSKMERGRLASQLSEMVATHERAATEQAEQQSALRRSVDEYQHELFGLQAKFEDASAERARLMTLLDESAAHHRQVAILHDAERARFEEALMATAAQQSATEKAMADHRLELQSVDQAARRIEPLAAAGRLAIDVARELLAAVADIDARTACLVAECPVDSVSREEVEQLRVDAIRVGSLARQILHSSQISQLEERT